MAQINPDLQLPNNTDKDLARALKQAWRDMVNQINNFLTVYNQATRPVIPDGTMSLWCKPDGTFHIVANFGKGIIRDWGQP